MEANEFRDRKHNPRFSRVALQALKGWLKSHHDFPYPTEDEKAILAKVTGLNLGQINLWFANARRRSKHLPSASASQKLARHNHYEATRLASPHAILGHSHNLHLQEAMNVLSVITTCPQDVTTKIYQCTFCPDTFKTKYDWTRHEMSLHLPLKRYICCPFSPTVEVPATKAKACSYCGTHNPTMDHIETHNHSYCQERDPETRTFFRKDHLRKHLQSVHESRLLPHMDAWLLEAVFINSRCGLCGQRFSIWKERNDHIAAHFKEGLSMDQWKGCRGLDASISADYRH